MALFDFIPSYFLKTKTSTPVNVYMVDNAAIGKKFGTSATGNHKPINDFETIPDLFIITNFLSKRVARVPIKVVKQSGKLAPNSDLLRLVKDPNYYQSWQELIRANYAYYNILGNSYLYGIEANGFGGRITSLFNLPAEKTVIDLAFDKSLPNWVNEVKGYVVSIGGTEYHLKPETVLHNRNISLRYDSGAWVYGISKYIPGDKINNELRAIYDAKASIIEHRGALGIISNDSEFPDLEQTQIVKDRLKQQFGLSGDQDKFIVTTQKLSWQQMSLNVQELQLIENAKYSFEKLCQLSEFDPVIFTADGSTFANKTEAIKDLYKNVIKTDVDDLYDTLNEWLSPLYGGDKIVPDWNKVQELENDKKIFTDMLTKQIEYSLITPYSAAKILYGDDVDESNPPPDIYYQKGLKELGAEEPEPEPVVDEVITAEMIKNARNGKTD
jgi:HK97 family phage portal protein